MLQLIYTILVFELARLHNRSKKQRRAFILKLNFILLAKMHLGCFQEKGTRDRVNILQFLAVQL